jgi:Flp pilus assembly CpaF family ATPase
MRIEYANRITGKTGFKELSPRLNPVRIGQHSANHLVLESPFVGAEAAVFENDVAAGVGWRFWNRNGKPIKINDTVVSRKDEFVAVPGRKVQVEIHPFVLTVILDDVESTEAASGQAIQSAAIEVVREIHQALLGMHTQDPSDRSEWLRDAYIHQLETEIEETAAGRVDLPDVRMSTPLGDHLAGMAVRGCLISRLIRRSGVKTESFKDEAEVDAWRRLRTRQPELEDELERLVARLHVGLGLDGIADLSLQMSAVRERFWKLWEDLLRRGNGAPLLPMRRYLCHRRLKEEIKDFWFGFGPLEELLDDPTINEIMVVDANTIFIEKDGMLENSGRRFLTDPLTIINKIAAKAKRQISEAQPLLDARMPDGSRVNAVVPSLALKGPCLTIRRFPKQRITVADLVEKFRSISPAARNFLEAAVVNRRNIIVSGGTGTGKTTLLNAIAGFIPDKERVVTIEDTAELQVNKPHVVTMQARQRNNEGGGEVSIRDLVKNSLRMRPDRIVVGECRGGEAIDMLQAMNTGHDGSMTTLHANSPQGVIERLEVLVQQNADAVLPVSAIHRQVVSAVDLIVQLGTLTVDEEREVPGGPGGTLKKVTLRRKRKVVTEIAEVIGVEEEGVRIVSLFRRRGELGELRPTGCLPSFLAALIETGLVSDPVEMLTGRGAA